MDRTASAVWHGDLKTGKGTITTQSKTLNATQYSFKSRFEEGVGTNPEELIAAAHATLETTDAGPTVTKIHLTTRAQVPGIEVDKFNELAKKAKEGCPISRLLAAAEITLDAQLV